MEPYTALNKDLIIETRMAHSSLYGTVARSDFRAKAVRERQSSGRAPAARWMRRV